MNPSPSAIDPVDAISHSLLTFVQKYRVNLDEAANYAKANMGLSPALVDEAIARLKARAKSTQTVSAAVVSPGTTETAWYLGPEPGGHWERYMEGLRVERAPGLEDLDDETTRITALLANPHAKGHRRKGLVMGNVQSGKTRNFAGVVAKAADAGYKFVVILSGMHNNLREQTQARLDAQLFNGKDWYPLTTGEHDFEVPTKPAELFLHQPILCAVIKKNSNRLAKLVSMLGDPAMKPVMANVPVLIIDDEADQATPNSLKEKDDVSKINGLLRHLWGSVATGTYVAYTATPFANVLMDPDNESDLFPSDFITTIEPGTGYFGAERVFGLSETVLDDPSDAADGLNMVRKIPLTDAQVLKPPSNKELREEFDPDPPVSMLEAFDWFVVATAIRRARGQLGHSSMLIHTTHYADPHFAMQERMEIEVHRALIAAARGDVARFHEAWLRESEAVASEASEPLPSWNEVEAALQDVLNCARVIVDNGSSKDRLNYTTSDGQVVVAIGGGTLSRGLTLEGLVVSYFTRTSNTYDTLLQMGRWFGYRNGYEDLPRIWVTDGLDKDYAFLARVEKDLREEIQAVQNSDFTPEQVGVKVRSHPGRLAVTSANRMYDAKVVQLGLSGTANQTFLLDGDPSVSSANIRAVESLIEGRALESIEWSKPRLMARKVQGDRVSTFIHSFGVHSSQGWLDSENRKNITDWITKWAPGDCWNVVLVSNSNPEPHLGTLTITGQQLHCLDRSPLWESTPNRIDMKAVMSAGDRLADLDPNEFPFAPKNDVDRRRIRRLMRHGEGLIVVYPLSAAATAAPPTKGGFQARMDMPAEDHLLAFAIVYPTVNDEDGRQGSFISVRRNWDVPTVVEGDESEEESADE